MLRFTAAFAALTLLAACSTPTPYAPALQEGGRGYSDTQIESNRFRISFSGNSITGRETVETYLLYRAAELTLAEGYDHFIVVTRATDAENRAIPTGVDPFFHPGFSVRYRYYHPYYGWRGRYDPFWDDRGYREVTRYEASAEIVLGRGPKPDDPQAFNASEVAANLGAQIMRPEAP